jgi:hypothetical protein
MNWNAYVLSLADKGYAPEDIVAEANMPLLTLRYVEDVLEAERCKLKPNYVHSTRYSNPETDENKRLLANVRLVGEGVFLGRVKNEGYEKLAIELNTTAKHLKLFTEKYVNGIHRSPIMGDQPTYERYLIKIGKMKKKEKVVKLQEITNLW